MIPLSQPQEGAVTFAQPDETLPYSERLRNSVSGLALVSPTIVGAGAIAGRIGTELITNPQGFADLIGSAFNQNLKVESLTARNVSTEEAYDRRIKAIKEATGVTLENPLRGGFREELARANREDIMIRSQSADQEPAAPLTGGAIFERKLSELRAANPDKAEALAFGDIAAEAKAIAKGAEDEYEHARKTTTLSLPSSLAAQFIGGAAGQYRDPLFVGSLVAGPTTAVGKTVAARIATAGLFQGLYNMGISALEQPVVQEWRREVGLRSGVQPALENVGLAFVFGAIPGAAFRGAHEISAGAKASMQRVFEGAPREGDLEKTMQAARSVLGEIDAEIPGLGRKEQAAIKLGEEMDAVEKITQPRPPKEIAPEQPAGFTTAKGSTYELHDDGTTTRVKAARSDPGHEGDSGLKPRTERTVYVDDARLASALSSAGLQNVGSSRVIIKDGKASLLTWNEQAGRWGRSQISTDIPVSDIPAVGKAPLELWKKTDDIPGYEAYRGMHAGNAITEMRPRQPPQYKDGMSPELHDDLTTAAQRYADDPVNAPSPAGVAAVEVGKPPLLVVARRMPDGSIRYGEPGQLHFDLIDPAERRAISAGEQFPAPTDDMGFAVPGGQFMSRDEALTFVKANEPARAALAHTPTGLEATKYRDSTPIPPEVTDRIAAAQPRTLAEAQKAASEAIEDIGNRESIARTRGQMDAERLPAPEPLPEGVKPPPASSKDPLDKVAILNEDGTSVRTISAQAAAREGERDLRFAELIRECK